MEVYGVALENIIIGLLSGGIVALFYAIKDAIRNYIIEQRYDLSGEYITKYRDNRGKDRVTVTAKAEIEQSGKDIHVETSLGEGGKKWFLEGEISNERYIHGIYHSEDPRDEGVGNFFLEVKPDKNLVMEGLWSGYDSLNQKVNYGNYKMTKMKKDFEIRNMKKKHIPEVINISDRQLGESYFGNNINRKDIKSKNKIYRVAIERKKRVIGFSYSKVLIEEGIESYIESKNLKRSLSHSRKVGILSTVAVESEKEGKGVGTELIGDSIEHIEKKGAEMIMATAWKSEGQVNVSSILKFYDFKKIEEVDEYWKDQSIQDSFNCPSCGAPPCTCSAVIFAKTVHAK